MAASKSSVSVCAIALAFALALAVAPVASSTAEDASFILDVPDGAAVVVGVDGIPRVVDLDAQPQGIERCGGQAPEVTYCATGEHADVFVHGFPAPFPDAATLESRLIHVDGASMFRCTYLGGETVSCSVSGTHPPIGATIFHDCYAYVPLTAGLLPFAPQPGDPTGVPGGLGTWECLIA